MTVKMTVNDFIQYFNQTKDRIYKEKDYVTELDSATGDGDHWVNVNKGFEQITSGLKDAPADLTFVDLFKNIGMTMFSSVGGSSGALYGSGYVAASKICKEKKYIHELDVHALYDVYHAILVEMMKRGKTEPGQKTMVDSLYSALQAYQEAMDAEKSEKEIIMAFIKGANDGAQATREMAAVKGRASYRTDKGVGHLDPGAITMAMQLESLGKYILNKE